MVAVLPRASCSNLGVFFYYYFCITATKHVICAQYGLVVDEASLPFDIECFKGLKSFVSNVYSDVHFHAPRSSLQKSVKLFCVFLVGVLNPNEFIDRRSQSCMIVCIGTTVGIKTTGGCKALCAFVSWKGRKGKKAKTTKKKTDSERSEQISVGRRRCTLGGRGA